jgi:hypothetical protein
MGLILRKEKGSKLSIKDMDDNLTYLESIGRIKSFNYNELKVIVDANGVKLSYMTGGVLTPAIVTD